MTVPFGSMPREALTTLFDCGLNVAEIRRCFNLATDTVRRYDCIMVTLIMNNRLEGQPRNRPDDPVPESAGREKDLHPVAGSALAAEPLSFRSMGDRGRCLLLRKR